MKILVLSFYFRPDLSAGSFRVSALVDKLLLRGFKVEVVTTSPNRYASFKPNNKDFSRHKNLEIKRITVSSHNSGMLGQIRSFLCFYTQAKKHVKNKNYDLIFSTSSRLFTAFLGAVIANKKKLPLYLDIRDIFSDTINFVLPPFINKLTLFIVLFFEKYTFNSAGRINLVSRGFLPYFQSNFTNKEYRFFTNGVDDIFINMHDNNVHPKTDKIRNEILYAGNIGAGQGLHKIIPSLASELKDKYYIKIIGDGGKLGKLKKETQKHKLDNVIFVKPMIREKLLEEYKNADILFLHLNDYLCFEKVLPSKLFEYAATGKPILAGLAGYSKEFLKNEIQNSESFRPNNHKEAIKALEKLNNTSTIRSYFIQKFSREKIITDMTSDIIEFVNKEKTD